MRVTSSMMISNYLNNLSSNLNRLSKLENQLATNRKYSHISDDPISVIYSQQARYKLNRLNHYIKNVETSQNWLGQAEEGVMDLNEIIKSAYESAIDAATDVKSDEDKANASEYVGQLRDMILQSLNSTFGDKFVFGGYNTTGTIGGTASQPPFTVNDAGKLCFNGVDLTDPANQDTIEDLMKDVLTFDVGVGAEIEATLNGIELAIYNTNGGNLYNLLDDLYNSMKNGDSVDVISGTADKLQSAQSHMLALAAEIGGRTNRLDILSLRYEKDEINYTQMMSNAEDADQAEVIMQYKMAESVYKAALATGSFVIMPTLMNFLN